MSASLVSSAFHSLILSRHGKCNSPSGQSSQSLKEILKLLILDVVKDKCSCMLVNFFFYNRNVIMTALFALCLVAFTVILFHILLQKTLVFLCIIETKPNNTNAIFSELCIFLALAPCLGKDSVPQLKSHPKGRPIQINMHLMPALLLQHGWMCHETNGSVMVKKITRDDKPSETQRGKQNKKI